MLMAIATPDIETEVDDRDRRAASEAMTVVGFGPLLFEVYTTDAVYRVDLKDDRCLCDDHRYRGVTCKHSRRVEMALGLRDIPSGVDIDYVLANRAAVNEDGFNE